MLTHTRGGELFRLRPKGYTSKGILRFFNDTIRVEGDDPFEVRASADAMVVQGTWFSHCNVAAINLPASALGDVL